MLKSFQKTVNMEYYAPVHAPDVETPPNWMEEDNETQDPVWPVSSWLRWRAATVKHRVAESAHFQVCMSTSTSIWMKYLASLLNLQLSLRMHE